MKIHIFALRLLAELVERCTGIAEVMGSNPVRAWNFFQVLLTTTCFSSVLSCEDLLISSYLNILLLNCSKKHSMNRPGFAMNILPQRSRLLGNQLVHLFTYLRIRFIFPLNSSSHACVLMARIPEITWFNKEKRLSETAAVRRRSVAHREDNATKYGTRKKGIWLPWELANQLNTQEKL